MSGADKREESRPFTIRLTVEERRELERRAGEMALGSYIKTMLFAHGLKHRHRGRRSPIRDQQLLAQLLACLGSSRLSETLERLAEAAESGVVQWDDTAPQTIKKAVTDIAAMRLVLLKCLGFQVDLAAVPESVSQSFARAARHDPDWMAEDAGETS